MWMAHVLRRNNKWVQVGWESLKEPLPYRLHPKGALPPAYSTIISGVCFRVQGGIRALGHSHINNAARCRGRRQPAINMTSVGNKDVILYPRAGGGGVRPPGNPPIIWEVWTPGMSRFLYVKVCMERAATDWPHVNLHTHTYIYYMPQLRVNVIM